MIRASWKALTLSAGFQQPSGQHTLGVASCFQSNLSRFAGQHWIIHIECRHPCRALKLGLFRLCGALRFLLLWITWSMPSINKLHKLQTKNFRQSDLLSASNSSFTCCRMERKTANLKEGVFESGIFFCESRKPSRMPRLSGTVRFFLAKTAWGQGPVPGPTTFLPTSANLSPTHAGQG